MINWTISTKSPYALRDIVDWLQRELTTAELGTFTELWRGNADLSDYLTDEELEKLALDRLDLEALAEDHLTTLQIARLADNRLSVSQIADLASSLNTDTLEVLVARSKG